MKQKIEETVQELANEQKIQLVLSQDPNGQDMDEISLAELFKKILDGKKLIAICTLVALVVSSLGFLGYNVILPADKGSTSTIISFNFPGIEEGLNPAEEPFEIGELVSKEVLETTVAEYGLSAKGINSEMLRRNLSIQGIVPQSVAQRIELINKMAEKDVTQLEKISELEYHPTQYKLALHIDKDVDLDGETANQVLMGIVENYKEYFMNKYNDKELLSTAITTVNPAQYDYAEYILMAEEELKLAEQMLEEKLEDNETFRAKSTGMSFGDLLNQVELLKGVEINNVQATIKAYMITKDKDKLTSLYQNKINTMNLEMQQYAQEANSLKKTLAEYKKDQAVVVGPEGTQTTVEMSKDSEMYDKLTEDMLAAQNKVNELKYEIQYHQDLLTKLQPVEGIPQVDLTSYTKQVEQNIQNISEQTNALIGTINETLEEYYNVEVFKNSVRLDVPAMYQSNKMATIKQGALIIIVATMLGAIVGVLMALSKGMLSEESN